MVVKSLTLSSIRCLFSFLFLFSGLYAASKGNAQGVNQKKECVVLLCNKRYFPKFLDTVQLLVTKGNYHGDICLVIGDDLVGDELLNHKVIRKNHILVKHFPDLSFPDSFLDVARNLPNFGKLFQYHKLHLFNTYFKQWQTLLYIDCGMKIHSDIRPILKAKKSGVLLAHSDAYPSYFWKLYDQFSKEEADYYDKLSENFNLEVDYFQTTMMLYDTSIIQEDTFQNLYDLALKYPISITNDQGIIALYFTNIAAVWEQIALHDEKRFFYDYLKREKGNKYIMLKN